MKLLLAALGLAATATEAEAVAALDALKTQSGSDLAVIEGLQAIIVKEGLGRTPLAIADPDKLIDAAVTASGVDLETLTRAAQMLANAVSPVILYGKGVTAQRSEALVQALLTLAKLTGAVDSERFGLLSVKGEANSTAAAQLNLDKQFTLNGQKAVFALIGDDYLSKRMTALLTGAPYLVVQASYLSPVTEKADVVLPVGLWSEQAGHYVSMDGRLQTAEKAVDAPEGVRENTAVLAEIAMRMNMPVKQDWHAALNARTASVTIS